MQSVSRTGLLAAGFGLAAVGGFVGGLLREQAALTALRGVAGEGSEDLVSWAVGSYRSRWTTFRPPQALPLLCLLGARPRQRRGRGKGGSPGAREGSLDLGSTAGVGVLRAGRLCRRGARRVRDVRPAGVCAALHGFPHQPGLAGRGAAADGVADPRLSRSGAGAGDGPDGRQGSDPARLQSHRGLRRCPLERAGMCAARRSSPRGRLQDRTAPPRFPRLRLELRTTISWKEDVELALDRLLGAVQKEPALRPL